MAITHPDLDSNVREHMERELEGDLDNDSLYLSSRLTNEGRGLWPDLLRQAIKTGDDASLALQIQNLRLTAMFEIGVTRGGEQVRAKVPRTAAETLAEGEFNRFYIRGVCRDVLKSGGSAVEVCRGKAVRIPRPESEARIGQKVDAAGLLADLRASVGVDTALGVPAGPNSGLTVRRA